MTTADSQSMMPICSIASTELTTQGSASIKGMKDQPSSIISISEIRNDCSQSIRQSDSQTVRQSDSQTVSKAQHQFYRSIFWENLTVSSQKIIVHREGSYRTLSWVCTATHRNNEFVTFSGRRHPIIQDGVFKTTESRFVKYSVTSCKIRSHNL